MVVNTDTNKVEGNYCFSKPFTDGLNRFNLVSMEKLRSNRFKKIFLL